MQEAFGFDRAPLGPTLPATHLHAALPHRRVVASSVTQKNMAAELLVNK